MSTNNVHPIFDGLLSAIDPSPKKSKLEQLLDAKFPITDQTSEDGKRLYEVWRDIFTEGYNARIAEEKEERGLSLPTPGYNREEIWCSCNKLIKNGLRVEAIELYKKATGCSVQMAKHLLNL